MRFRSSLAGDERDWSARPERPELLEVTSELERTRVSEVSTRMTLRVGDRAPDLALTSTTGERIALSSFLGRPVVLVFLRWLG